MFVHMYYVVPVEGLKLKLKQDFPFLLEVKSYTKKLHKYCWWSTKDHKDENKPANVLLGLFYIFHLAFPGQPALFP